MKKRNSISKNKNKIKNNDLYQSSESIIKIIIDKLINLSVRKSYSNKIDSQLGEYCFNFMKNNINSMFELNYIAHTKESKKSSKKGELFWGLKKPPHNTWVEIREPEYFEIDRYEGSKTKYKDLNEKKEEKKSDINNNDVHYNVNINTKNILQKSHFMQYKISNNNLAKISSKSILNDFIDKNENNKNLLLSKSIVNTNTNIKNDYKKEKNISQNDNNNTINRNKKNQMIEFPSDDISNLSEDNQKYDLPNVEFLRKEVEENILKKEEEKIRLKKEEEKEKILQKAIIDKKNKKLFDSNKLTFDSNGKIISFRRYNIDNLKDFVSTKNFIKEVKKNANKNISQKSLPNVNNNIISKTPIKTLKIKETEKDKDKDIEKNIIKQSQRQINKLSDRFIEKIIPSGSNFQLISPVIGVVIKENGQSKEGPKDFSKYFKKYSLKDYDDMLNNYLPNMNKKFLKTSFDNRPNRKSIINNVLNMNNIIQSNLNKKK